MNYYVQKFSYDERGDSTCYGEEDSHNHDKANQFTKDVQAYLVSQGCKNIITGAFLSAQPKPLNGKEFRWDKKQSKWVKT
jgi:hypothetical protein